MRLLLIACVLPLLAGCDALVRENGDYFQAGTDSGRFEVANLACDGEARDYVAYDVRGASSDTIYDRNRAYNAVYRRCMAGRGYSPRPYWQNFLPG
jgi:hypothetical protein